MVDYSLRTRELNDRLNAVTKSFRILDHHKTAQAALEGADYATFDMERSGAGLAWDYLFGKDLNVWEQPIPVGGIERPWWVNYTEDQDLWNWMLFGSQTINAYLMVQPRTVEVWDNIAKMPVSEAMELGKGVRSYIGYYTRSVIAERQEGLLFPEMPASQYATPQLMLRTAIVNIPYVGVSEAGAALVEMGYDLGLAWFERGDGIMQFSLRSKKGGDVDVSAIAKSYGGGGHQSAAGFQVNVKEGRALVDSILGREKNV